MDQAPPTAIVRPRARRVDVPGSEPHLVAEQVGALVAEGARGLVWIGGPPGSGKTTALRLLEQELAGSAAAFLDDPSPRQLRQAAEPLKVYAARRALAAPHVLQIELEPWSADDVLELLLARAPERCAELYPPLIADPLAPALDGLPALWAAVVSACAEGEPPRVARALRAHLRRTLGATPRRRLVSAAALAQLAHEERDLFRLRRRLERRHGRSPGDPLFRHALVRLLLASEHLASRLRAGRTPSAVFRSLPADVVERAGARIGPSGRARARLEDLIDDPRHSANAASLLHASDRRWLAGYLARHDKHRIRLAGARLQGAELAGARAQDLSVNRARLQGSDWEGSRVTTLRAEQARFAGASLRGAEITWLEGAEACLAGADLTGLSIEQAQLSAADLTGVRGRGARLTGADLTRASLTGADFRDAVMDGASFEQAQVERLSLAGASLTRAKLRGLDLRTADLRGADLTQADLSSANLEGLVLPDARLDGAVLLDAYLTGSRMPGAHLRAAFLVEAGLAEVEWEGADLAGANLASASFHLGSSRSGLVVGGYPSQGTRTGFYTDLRLDLDSLPPEQVRKANLCRADLRRAHVLRTDFYLVDLRGALYTPEQERHFRATGAILGDP